MGCCVCIGPFLGFPPLLCLLLYSVATVWSNSLELHLVPALLFFWHNRMQSQQMGWSNNRSIPSSVSTFPVSSVHPLAVSQPRQLTDGWQAVRDRRTAAGFWIGRQEAFISQQKITKRKRKGDLKLNNLVDCSWESHLDNLCIGHTLSV